MLGKKYLPETKSLPHLFWVGGPVIDEEVANTQRPVLACWFQVVTHLTPLNVILSNLPKTIQLEEKV